MEQTNLMMLLPENKVREIEDRLCNIESLLSTNLEKESSSGWLKSEEARKELGFCTRTWQLMRDRRVIPFSQFGRKIYFRRADIDAFMESNLVK